MTATPETEKSMQELFDAAVKFVQSLPADGDVKPDNATKLAFYAAFKQATEGDVKGDRPSAFSFVARAKWDAWQALKGKGKEDAMKVYVESLEGMAPQWKTQAKL